MSGSATINGKGHGAVPRRKISGQYAMIARQDNENLYLLYSDDRYCWSGGTAYTEAAVPLGVRADRQLWLTHRAG